MNTCNFYIGWDSREPIAADVCAHSLQRHSSIPLQITMLNQAELRENKVYWREVDKQGSTEFTFTRFLVPHLNNYKGWAIFSDCDFLFVDDIAKVLELANPEYAVMVVQHDYTPSHKIKMDGKEQHLYPRKNWSSFILWNCEHPSNRQLTPELVNQESGQFLHRFMWLKDHEIGSLPVAWNWLVNWYHEPEDGKPIAIHYTEGGPWFDNYRDCEYGDLWLQEEAQVLAKT